VTTTPRRGRPAVLYAAIGGVAALAIVAVVLVATGSGGAGGGDTRGADLGGALGTATTLASNAGTVRPGSSTTATTDGDGGAVGGDDAGSLPPVTVPAESSPPTTIPGSEPSSVPTDIFSGEEAPQFGTLVVDLEPGGYADFAVHLRAGQEVQLLSLADDGIETRIEVFAPDGSSEGSWEGGEPGVVNGLEWYQGDPLPATGTYVIRIVHTGGGHEPFALGFFGTA
jgi:hypothetical protein